MPLHYRKDGGLDMRYSSSRAASSGGSSFSYSGGSSSAYRSPSYSSYSAGSSNSGGLHYKKDGSLDMRYSSSKAAVSGGVGSGSGYASYAPSNSDLHYKKDGSLDMRFSSSKAAVSGGSAGNSSPFGSSNSNLHYKKDGTLDMRYKSSKEAESRLNSAFSKVAITSKGIPSHIPLTKSGLPDMRCKASKDWVAQQSGSGIPSWLPRKKDGSLDTSKAVTLPFLSNLGGQSGGHNRRQKYYEGRLEDDYFKECVDWFRDQPDTNEMVRVREPTLLENTKELKTSLMETSNLARRDDLPLDQMISSTNVGNVREIDYKEIRQSFGEDEEKAKIGSGSFGVVLNGTWKNNPVAVKRLHLSNLNKREKVSFVKEMKILALVGEHPNLVSLYGYCVDPPCLVMEFVEKGSLSFLLHYSEDPMVEAALTDGRTKKKIVSGIVAGMFQLHEVGVVHGDLKPANILVDVSYNAKITDFGLSSLRGKTSSTVASIALEGDGENVIAGTGAYMAPELLESIAPPDFKADVYSFAILVNEVVQEEEPFSGEEANFHGRGVFAAANYAKQGKRPFIGEKTPEKLREFIQNCWNAAPIKRPTFQQIVKLLENIEFPNSF